MRTELLVLVAAWEGAGKKIHAEKCQFLNRKTEKKYHRINILSSYLSPKKFRACANSSERNELAAAEGRLFGIPALFPSDVLDPDETQVSLQHQVSGCGVHRCPLQGKAPKDPGAPGSREAAQ